MKTFTAFAFAFAFLPALLFGQTKDFFLDEKIVTDAYKRFHIVELMASVQPLKLVTNLGPEGTILTEKEASFASFLRFKAPIIRDEKTTRSFKFSEYRIEFTDKKLIEVSIQGGIGNKFGLRRNFEVDIAGITTYGSQTLRRFSAGGMASFRWIAKKRTWDVHGSLGWAGLLRYQLESTHKLTKRSRLIVGTNQSSNYAAFQFVVGRADKTSMIVYVGNQKMPNEHSFFSKTPFFKIVVLQKEKGGKSSQFYAPFHSY